MRSPISRVWEEGNAIIPVGMIQISMLQGKLVMLIIVAVAGVLGGGVLTYAIGIPSSPCNGVVGVTRNFTIIADLNGFNGSKDHQPSRPVMNVKRCDMVIIKIINNDTQSHGFAVDNYAPRGAEIIGQQSATVQFLATASGQFRVYCNTFCTIHTFMQNGLLIVS